MQWALQPTSGRTCSGARKHHQNAPWWCPMIFQGRVIGGIHHDGAASTPVHVRRSNMIGIDGCCGLPAYCNALECLVGRPPVVLPTCRPRPAANQLALSRSKFRKALNGRASNVDVGEPQTTRWYSATTATSRETLP